MTDGVLKAAVEAAASGKSEEQRRIEIVRRARAGWFAGTHASGAFGIIARDGREVARFAREEDRDAVLGLAGLEAAAGAAVTALGFEEEAKFNAKADAVGFAQVTAAKDGLIKALDRRSYTSHTHPQNLVSGGRT